MSNKVVVVALDKRYKKLEKDLAGKAQKILLFLKQNGFGPFNKFRASQLTTSGVGLEIYLVPTSSMRKLNRQYRGKDAATNVLAFESPKNFPRISSRFLGEVYLSPTHIRKRGEDIVLLLTHGILHLIGFNHTSRSDRMVMEKVEEAIAAFVRERSERK